MQRVNIMVDVSDRVYDQVVVPFKKVHKFRYLIEKLLTGYLDNEVIASYVEDRLDDLQKEQTKAFSSVLDQMKSNLVVAGMLTDEAQVIAEQGKRAVSLDKTEENPDVSGYAKNKTVPSKEEELEKEVSDLKKQNEDVLKKLGELTEMVLSMTSSSKEVENNTIVGEVADDSDKKLYDTPIKEIETPDTVGDGLISSFDDDDPLAQEIDLFDDEDFSNFAITEEEEEEESEDDFLKNMLEGQVY